MSEDRTATALREALESWADHLRDLRGTRLVSIEVEQFREIVRLALAATAPSPAATGSEGVAEPVAWLYDARGIDHGWYPTASTWKPIHEAVHDVRNVRPLYVQPAPAAPTGDAVRALVIRCASKAIDGRGPPADYDYRDRHIIEGIALLRDEIEAALSQEPRHDAQP